MNTLVTLFSAPRWFGRGLLLGGVAVLLTALPRSALSQETTSYNCGFQSFTVPSGVTSITAVVQGAHGWNPDRGNEGGFGGLVQGSIAVTPGQTLWILVGCNDGSFGYGAGGDSGTANSPKAGDGGSGGGGSAVLLNAEGTQPLLVAGGGGGGGGDSEGENSGGRGGDGGHPAQPGQDGDRFSSDHTGGTGGCANCQTLTPPNGVRGLPGGGTSYSGAGGAGGGGGGGDGGDDWRVGGGGGGGGQSFAHSSVTNVFFGTSMLAGDGLVTVCWGTGCDAPETDGDTIPDALDQCPDSDLSPTVLVGGRDTGAENVLDVDGCTLADRIAELAAGAATRREFVGSVVRLTKELRRRRHITREERRAILRHAVVANLP